MSSSLEDGRSILRTSVASGAGRGQEVALRASYSAAVNTGASRVKANQVGNNNIARHNYVCICVYRVLKDICLNWNPQYVNL